MMEESFSTAAVISASASQLDIDKGECNTKRPDQDDLTNLNWVAGIPVPMNMSVSPPEGSKARKLNFGPSGTRNTEVTAPIPVKTRPLKLPLPTYKIIVKDHQKTGSTNAFPLSDQSSPEKRDPFILASILPSKTSRHNLDSLSEKLSDDEEEDDKESEVSVKPTVTPTSNNGTDEDSTLHQKPNCSYTCLIGMALKASNGCLPVNAIYQYIEKEFPYFLTAPDGWKNSVRHNLSLNPIFRKVNRQGWTGKKGYLWEVCPDKQELVDKEIVRFLHSTGKKLGEFTVPLNDTCYKYKQRSKKVRQAAPVICSRCTRIISPTPQDSSTSSDDSSITQLPSDEIKKYSSEIQQEMLSSSVPTKPKSTATESAFDTEKSPLKYVGLNPPSSDPKDTARELFGLGTTPEAPGSAFYPPLPYLPMYTQPNQFAMPLEQVMNNSSSSSTNSSPSAVPHQLPVPPFLQYAMPMPIHYMFGGHYPHFYGFDPSGGTVAQNGTDMFQKIPETVKILSSSTGGGEVGKNGIWVGHEVGNNASQNHSKEEIRRGKHQNNSCSYSDVANLSSPLKRMKVLDDGAKADESLSAYFADVSSNNTCSDDEEEKNKILPSIMSLFLKSAQQNDHNTLASAFPLADLSHISTKDREDLEGIAGTSDLGTLLNDGFESLAVKNMECKVDSANQQVSPSASKEQTGTGAAKGGAGGDVNSVGTKDSRVKATSCTRQENYYLPSLDSLLHIGDDTIVNLKTALNLDIQGVVEVATEDSSLHQESNKTPVPSETLSVAIS